MKIQAWTYLREQVGKTSLVEISEKQLKRLEMSIHAKKQQRKDGFTFSSVWRRLLGGRIRWWG
jgi:hypothetical protein